MLPLPRKAIKAATIGIKNPIYFKQKQTTIQLKDTISTTGSMWTNNTYPFSPYVEPVPNGVGDVVWVKMETETKTDGQEAPKPDKTKDLPMKIFAKDKDGSHILRYTESFDNGQDIANSRTLWAKVPPYKPLSFSMMVTDLTELTLEDSKDNSQYRTLAWNGTLKERLFAKPVIEEVKNDALWQKELKDKETALQSQAQGIQRERERMIKEQQRLSAWEERIRRGENNMPVTGKPTNTPQNATVQNSIPLKPGASVNPPNSGAVNNGNK